jgi:hypothetical protein
MDRLSGDLLGLSVGGVSRFPLPFLVPYDWCQSGLALVCDLSLSHIADTRLLPSIVGLSGTVFVIWIAFKRRHRQARAQNSGE